MASSARICVRERCRCASDALIYSQLGCAKTSNEQPPSVLLKNDGDKPNKILRGSVSALALNVLGGIPPLKKGAVYI